MRREIPNPLVEDIDDDAVLIFRKRLGHHLREDKWRTQIWPDMRVPALSCRGIDFIALEPRGVVDQTTNWPEVIGGLRHQAACFVFVRQICLQSNCPPAGRLDFGHHGFRIFSRTVVVNDDRPTPCGKIAGNGAAYSPCGTCHENGFWHRHGVRIGLLLGKFKRRVECCAVYLCGCRAPSAGCRSALIGCSQQSLG